MGWLYNQMALPETLFQAWNKVVSNDGMAGYDRQSITDYSWRIEEHLADLGKQLLTGTYEPQPLLKLVMLKPLTTRCSFSAFVNSVTMRSCSS